jgi:hypothetical protein
MPDEVFLPACLAAGAILTGFCGTFLSFRIQREANYYRQPVVDYHEGKGRDVYLGLSHFSSAFLLLIFGSLFAVIFGFILPLIALNGARIPHQLIVAGMVGAVIFIAGYFACELVHYGVLSRRLLNDRHEWGQSKATVWMTMIAAALTFGYIALA